MALEMKQQLRQTQQLVMTPLLQQAIKLLQCNHLEMLNAIEAELRENPVLETAANDDDAPNADSAVRNDLDALQDMTREPERPESDVFDIAWENYLENFGGDRDGRHSDGTDRMPLENIRSKASTLFQYLLEQLRLSDLNDADRAIALELIGNVNEEGYLDVDLSDIADAHGIDVAEVERVLREVQKFDPPGVAARDLRECLLIQAQNLHPPDSLVIRILQDHFDAFRKGKFDELIRKLKVSQNEAKDAIRAIASLNPKPGSLHSNSDTVYVTPDIYIVKIGNDYSIIVNDEGIPRLKINPLYQKELHSKDCSPLTKEYIHEKMKGAVWLIKSIHQRQRTIYKVTESILKFQRDFFDKGIDHLKPLILKDVADDIGMHESTVSRVTSNKFVHTPRGIFELKYFFNSGIPQGKESIASESVKNHIMRIVKNEDPAKPVSDQDIVEELKRSQIHIARRTVAKYRELLGIPSSSRRKKRF
jgi:RNA polymerase sigma-54 factor|uniref:RNA polymerase sigma-54 factor n=1 Tax=Desulfomonile tiedjei TaxID=2358 RepID=A0A7C4ERW6_9BACT